MGVYEHKMKEVELIYKDLKVNQPERFELFRTTMRKAFNFMLMALDMDDYDINQPLTQEIIKDPNHPAT